MTITAIILAAGEGTRMRSTRPKPLHRICGRPMVVHVIHALEKLHPTRTVVVVGHGAELVRDEQDGRAVLGDEMNERVTEQALRLRVDAGDGLVEHEQLGISDERLGDQDALLLAA